MAFFSKIKDCIPNLIEKIKEVIGLGTPTAFVTGVQLASIDLKKVDIVFDVLVTNPTRMTIPLTDISYLVESDGRKLVSGSITDSQTINPKSSATVAIPVTLVFEDILSIYADIRPGSVVPYKMKVDFGVDMPFFGKATVPVEQTGEIPIPQVPEISLEKLQFEKFTFDECVASIHLKLVNTNEFELGVTSLEYELQLTGMSVGSAAMEKAASFDKISRISLIEIPLTFRPKNLGNAVWQVISGKEATYTIKGSIGVDTPFGKMNFPFTQEGGTSLMK